MGIQNRSEEVSRFPDTKFWALASDWQGLGKTVRTWFDSTTLLLVTDSVIEKAIGQSFLKAAEREVLPITDTLVLPGSPPLSAEYRWIEEIIRKAGPYYEKAGESTAPGPLLTSLGSGTVNDLVKRAAGELGIPYLSIPTAPSVDGYSSFGAAILKDNFKQTLACPAPRVIFAAPEVLASAPAELIAAGYGDLASKITAGSDWILADAFGQDPIDPQAWKLVQDELYDRLSADEEKLPEELFIGLLQTGFAMQYLASSRPVSGAEHLIAHIWEMEHLEVDGKTVLHGNKVALGLLTVTAFTAEACAILRDGVNAESLPVPPDIEHRTTEVRMLCSHLPEAAVETIEEVALEKLPDSEVLRERYKRNTGWYRDLADRAESRLISFDQLREKLARAGCPTAPFELGISREHFLRTIRIAQMIRNRYTVLDLAWELGIFEHCLERTAARFSWE